MCSKDETLIIIGNGFDLFHGLATKFSDFAKYLKEKEVCAEMKNYFDLKEDDEWNQIEEKIKEYISKYEENMPKQEFDLYYRGGFKSDKNLEGFNNMLEKFKDEFVKYLKTLNINKEVYNQNVYDLVSECKILSFNYTKTIEEVYKNDKIIYLHGKLTDECIGRDICIGYDSINMGFENIPMSIVKKFNSYNNECIRNRVNKATQIMNFTNGEGNKLCNIKKLDKLSEFKKIIIFGHSLGKSDALLMDQLKKYNGQIEIIDYWENEEKENTIRSRVSSILRDKKFTLENSKDFKNTKVSKNIDELAKYLNEEKNIVDIDEVGKEKLLAIGYLNLITPYKHFFHCGRNESGRHQYNKKTLINDYIILYEDDLKQTTLIRDVVYNFERLIKSNINNYISNKYCSQDIHIVKEMILSDIEARILYINKQTETNQAMKYKVELLGKLKERFLDRKSFYLAINQLELSHLRTVLEVYNVPRKEVRYFKNNFKLFRILRNSLSHGDTVQIHLNRLCNKDYIKTIELIKRINKFNIKTSNQIKYNLLNFSYEKYHDKFDIE